MVVNVKQQNFGHYVDPYTRKKARVKKITMTNEKNISVSVLTLGALIHSVKVPDSCGNIADVCLGFDDIQGYRENQASYFGATIGRVANRIGCGRFNLGGKEIELTRNFKDKYHYNGGLVGFDCVNWKILSINPAGVTMEFVSHDGKEGYPGDLTAKIEYSLADNGALRIIMEATASQTTIVNMTNNTYFNLAGHAAGKDALGAHCLMIKADRIVDTDLQQLPTGSLMPIKNTPYDFRQITNLGQRIRKLRDCPIHGFDNCFCVDPPGNRTALIAKIVHSCSGRWMEVHSNQPALYFYTANNMPDAENGSAPLIGRDGANYVKHCAFVVSTQKYPDAPNNINFQSIAINPGEKYVHECVYRFGFCLKK